MSASEQTSPAGPRVFISYSHDSPEHCDRVFHLAQQLRRDGVNAELDQFHQEELKHWPRWCAAQMENSEFVLCVCTPEYKRRVEGRVAADVGKGVFWEGTLIYNYLYDSKENQRFVPVLLYEHAHEADSRLVTSTRPPARSLKSCFTASRTLLESTLSKSRTQRPVLARRASMTFFFLISRSFGDSAP
jgi:TIR domain